MFPACLFYLPAEPSSRPVCFRFNRSPDRFEHGLAGGINTENPCLEVQYQQSQLLQQVSSASGFYPLGLNATLPAHR